jgi:hypothetical protein
MIKKSINIVMGKIRIRENLKLLVLNKIFFYFIFCFTFLSIFILIKIYAVNVPYWDQWRTVEALIRFHENTFQFSDFWLQHNEHRIFFPLLIGFVIDYFSNLNVIYEIYFSLFLILVLSIIFYAVFTEEFKNIKYNYFYFIPVLFLLVTFRQYTNFLWGFEICVYLSILSVVLSIYFLIHYNNFNGVLFGALTGIVAIFSFVTGLLILPIGALILVALNRKKTEILTWVLFSAMMLSLFFWNWVKPSSISSVFNFNGISDLLLDFCVLIGSPLADNVTSAVVFGFVVLLISIVLYIWFLNLIL